MPRPAMQCMSVDLPEPETHDGSHFDTFEFHVHMVQRGHLVVIDCQSIYIRT